MSLPRHSAQMRNDIADAVLAAIDSGTAGNLIFKTAGDAVVATLALQVPAGTVTGPTLTFTAPNDDTNAAGNASPITKFSVEDSAAAEILTGDVTTVGVGTGDIQLDAVIIDNGDTVSISSFSYTAPL